MERGTLSSAVFVSRQFFGYYQLVSKYGKNGLNMADATKERNASENVILVTRFPPYYTTVLYHTLPQNDTPFSSVSLYSISYQS
jgi:hypothetical protein